MSVPTATYRLQLNRDFTCSAADGIAEYLADLGIGSAGASPILRARPGSAHGYDVTDVSRLNSELGSPEEMAGAFAVLPVAPIEVPA